MSGLSKPHLTRRIGDLCRQMDTISGNGHGLVWVSTARRPHVPFRLPAEVVLKALAAEASELREMREKL
jgi:hypothetical protein